MKHKYLSQEEINSLLRAAKKRSDRDYAIIFLSYRHGLRCSELLKLRWEWIDWGKKNLFIERVKHSDSGFHPLANDEISLLKRMKKQSNSSYIISSRQDSCLKTSRVRQICKELALEAEIRHDFHHHMLRHSCAFMMADNPHINPLIVQRYLGHRDSKSTEVYINEAGREFKSVGEWWN